MTAFPSNPQITKSQMKRLKAQGAATGRVISTEPNTSNSSKSDLNKCPGCGYDPVTIVRDGATCSDRDPYRVACPKCGTRGPSNKYRYKAIAIWNSFSN